MDRARRASLFRNGRRRAIRIPKAFELPGQEVVIRKDGDQLVIQPVKCSSAIQYSMTKEPLDEDFPEIEDPLPEPVDL